MDTINTHLIFWNVYPETTPEQRRAQTEDFFAMGGIPEVQGQLLGRFLGHDHPLGLPGRKQANPYRPRSLSNFESRSIRGPADYIFCIEFPDAADEAEGRYGPHQLHLDFAWRNCRTIWSEFIHQDFVTTTVDSGKDKPERRVLHYDFWNLWPDAEPASVEDMYSYLAEMPNKSPDILRIRFGRRDPLRPRGSTMIGVKEEIGLRGTAPWHFQNAGGQFDGYFQMEFASIDACMRYHESRARLDFAEQFVGQNWSEFFTQRFERIPPPA